MASGDTLINAIGLLEAAFGPQESPRIKLYMAKLKGTPDADLAAAVDRCVNELRAFPTIRDILDRLPGRLSLEQQAEAAWSRVMKSAFGGPVYHNPYTGSFPTGEDLDPASLDAIGGTNGLYRLWQAEDDPQQMGFARRDFIERFKTMTQMEVAGFLPTGDPISVAALGIGTAGLFPKAPDLSLEAIETRKAAAIRQLAEMEDVQ